MKRALSIQHRISLLLLLVLVAALCLVPAVSYADESADGKQSPYHTLTDLEGKRIAVLTGSVMDQMVEERIPNAEVVYVNAVPDLLLVLESNAADACAYDEMIKYTFLTENPDIAIVDEPLDVGKVGVCFNKDSELGQRLCAQFNEFNKAIEADGRKQALRDKWFRTDYDQNPAVDFSDLQGLNGTLNIYLDQMVPPVSYLKNGEATGFDLDMIHMFCQEYGYIPEFYNSAIPATIQAIGSGKADMGLGYLSITDERAQQVLFSDPYANNNIMLYTKSEEALAGSGAASASSATDSMTASFKRTFIEENRWLLYAEGLGTTLLITLLATVLGTALAFLLCSMARVGRPWMRGIVTALNVFAAGIPILVFLMVLFYVVFAKVDIPAILVASLGFAIYFGQELGAALKNSLDTVPKGQWESCHVMSMSRMQTLRYVILPQVFPVVLPQYKTMIVNLLKGTSIVGYITIQDLTRVSDIIRSRTFDALFPLLCAAVLYFAVVWIIILIFNRIQFRTSPAQRVPKLGGVKLTSLTEGQIDPGNYRDTFRKVDGVAGEPIIEMAHVRKEYPNAVPLADVTGTVRRGDVVSIIGPSGTGKTTLIRLINGLEPVSSGSIKVFDTEITAPGIDLSEATKHTNMVFQHFNLFPHLTVVENIMLVPVIVNDVPVQDAFVRAMNLLNIVDLLSKAFNYPSELSGGQQQRVAIVRAMAADPDAIMFDEPTSALDPASIDEVINVLGRLRAAGMTMMIVTHDMRLAREVSTRIFYMDEGQIYEEGTPEQIFDEPQRRLTQQFIRQLKVWDVVIEDRIFDYLGMLSSVRAFIKKYEIDKPLATALYAQVETMVDKALELLDADVSIRCFVEYSAKERDANVCLRYDGPPRDIMREFDEASLEIVELYADEIVYQYTTRNEYVIDCKPYDLREHLAGQ